MRALVRHRQAAVLRDAPLGDVDVGHDLQRGEITPDWIAWASADVSCSTPSIRYRTRRSCSVGSMWMSEARSVMACVMSRLTYLTIGASSTTCVDPRQVARPRPPGGAAAPRSSSLAVARGRSRSIAAQEVVAGRDDRPRLHPGERADVVEREDVAGVGHREHQPAVLVADRQHDVPPADRARHQRDGGRVDRRLVEVDERQPDLARRAPRPAGSRSARRARPAPARGCGRRAGARRSAASQLRLRDEALLEQDVGELLHARPRRRCERAVDVSTSGVTRTRAGRPDAVRQRPGTGDAPSAVESRLSRGVAAAGLAARRASRPAAAAWPVISRTCAAAWCSSMPNPPHDGSAGGAPRGGQRASATGGRRRRAARPPAARRRRQPGRPRGRRRRRAACRRRRRPPAAHGDVVQRPEHRADAEPLRGREQLAGPLRRPDLHDRRRAPQLAQRGERRRTPSRPPPSTTAEPHRRGDAGLASAATMPCDVGVVAADRRPAAARRPAPRSRCSPPPTARASGLDVRRAAASRPA